MKCLVTGGAGFIGSNLALALLEGGHTVRVLDNLSTGHRSNLEPAGNRIDFREDDLRDAVATARASEDMEVIFHQAALPSVPRSVADPLASHDSNARGTLNLLIGARDARVRRVVYAASSSAYGDTPTLPKHEGMVQSPLSPYAADKLHGEHLCQAFFASYGLECVCLRYFNVFGPRQRADSAYAAVIPKFITAVIEGTSPVIHGDGQQRRDFTYIDNVVAANSCAAKASGAGGQVFNVGFGKSWSLLELLDLVTGILGKPATPVHEDRRPGDVRDSLADISRARDVLDYQPLVGLKDGLELTIKWIQERGNPSL